MVDPIVLFGTFILEYKNSKIEWLTACARGEIWISLRIFLQEWSSQTNTSVFAGIRRKQTHINIKEANEEKWRTFKNVYANKIILQPVPPIEKRVYDIEQIIETKSHRHQNWRAKMANKMILESRHLFKITISPLLLQQWIHILNENIDNYFDQE